MPPRRTTEASPSGPPVALPGNGPAAGEIDLGYVSGVFGVRGEVRLFLHNPTSDLFASPRRVVLIGPDGQRVAAWLSARSGAGKRVLGRITGVDDPDAAASWMDWRVVVPGSELPALEPGEFYYWQLEGLPVLVGGESAGVITAVHATEGGEILEIDTGRDVAFVPAVERYVLRVDLDAGEVELAADALEEG